jgi:hypothetical protein
MFIDAAHQFRYNYTVKLFFQLFYWPFLLGRVLQEAAPRGAIVHAR